MPNGIGGTPRCVGRTPPSATNGSRKICIGRSLWLPRGVHQACSTGLSELVDLVPRRHFILLERLHLGLEPTILDLETLLTVGVSTCRWPLTSRRSIGACQRYIHVGLGRWIGNFVDSLQLLGESKSGELGYFFNAILTGSRHRRQAADLLRLLTVRGLGLLF